MADQKFIQYGNKKMPMGSLTLEQAKQTMARFFPELAEPKIETKKDGDDTIYVFTKQAGRKGGAGQEPAEIWTVDQDERVDGAHQVVDHDGMTIAFMATGGDAEETLERAYLIAAAPAMYAALRPTHSLFFFVDEAHQLCPQVGTVESSAAIKRIMDSGRKREICGMLATQRVTKLHNDAIGEARNVAIGLTNLAADQERAGDLLGMNKQQRGLLSRVGKGEFYLYGPSVLAQGVSFFKSDQVRTTHPQVGQRSLLQVPPASEAMQKILGKLGDLPAPIVVPFVPHRAEQRAPMASTISPSPMVGSEISRYMRDLLETFARWHPFALTKAELALRAKKGKNSSELDKQLARAKQARFVTDGQEMSLTELGFAVIGKQMPAFPPEPRERIHLLRETLDAYRRAMFDVLVDAGSAGVTVEELAQRSGKSRTSSEFDKGLAMFAKYKISERVGERLRLGAMVTQ